MMRSLYWLPALVLYVSALQAAPPLPAVGDLTPEAQARIDRGALASTLDNLRPAPLDLAGNVTAWMISQASLTAEEEAQATRLALADLQEKVKITPAPPEAVRLFQTLVKTLPPSLKADAFTYQLFVIDHKESLLFTCGAGQLLISRPLLELLQAAGPRGQEPLAFLLAHELGHVARQHCRRGYQLMQLQEEIRKGIDLHVEAGVLRQIMQTGINPATSLVRFLYSPGQEFEADLFALHLCRNAGLDLDRCLDALRWQVLLVHPNLLRQDNYVPDPQARLATGLYQIAAHPDPLSRLKRLLEDRDGLFPADGLHGLFFYNRPTGKFIRAERGAVGREQAPVIVVHGMKGEGESFATLLRTAARRDDLEQRPLLAFRYPNDGSLTRAGEFLGREMARVVQAPERAVFVCHSAGGLIFRYYAERKKGAFERVFFLGTPHGGSDMTALKFLLDAGRFVRVAWNLGLPDAVARTIAEGRGEIGHDLMPDSLFLRYLGDEPPAELARRYHIYYGRYYTGPIGLVLKAAWQQARPQVRERMADRIPSPLVKRLVVEAIDKVDLPLEVLVGDLLVAVSSATRLKGVEDLTATRLDHMSLLSDPQLIRQVLDRIAKR